MMVSPMQKMSLRVRGLLDDRSGLAAVEFAMIFPIMVVMFFGVVELSAAISAYRKAILAARTLSDLTSQMKSVADADLISFGEAAKAIMTPYPPSPLISSITEVYVDNPSGVARVQWSKGLTINASGNVSIAPTAPHNPGDVVVLPTTLVAAKGTYVIWSEVSYKYTPAVGYMLAKTGLTFKDAAFTRPRLVLCVIYPTPSGTLPKDCPTPL
jgi:Flp pilus assembly protein TadG